MPIARGGLSDAKIYVEAYEELRPAPEIKQGMEKVLGLFATSVNEARSQTKEDGWVRDRSLNME